jgi:hypothetical protein
LLKPKDALKTPKGSLPKALSVSIALKSGPVGDESGSSVGRRYKIVSFGVYININLAAPILLALFSAQTHNKSLPPAREMANCRAFLK